MYEHEVHTPTRRRQGATVAVALGCREGLQALRPKSEVANACRGVGRGRACVAEPRRRSRHVRTTVPCRTAPLNVWRGSPKIRKRWKKFPSPFLTREWNHKFRDLLVNKGFYEKLTLLPSLGVPLSHKGNLPKIKSREDSTDPSFLLVSKGTSSVPVPLIEKRNDTHTHAHVRMPRPFSLPRKSVRVNRNYSVLGDRGRWGAKQKEIRKLKLNVFSPLLSSSLRVHENLHLNS